MSGFLIHIGRKRTFWISISILSISIYTIFHFLYFKYKSHPYYKMWFTNRLIIEVIISTIFTFLLSLTYNGKEWAKQLAIIFLSIGVFMSTIYISTNLNYIGNCYSYFNPTVSLITIFIYLIGILHFAFSKSFKVFSKYQNSK